MDIMQKIKELKIVPVVVLNQLEDTLPNIGALVKGGLPVAEITFRTACAADAIKLAVKEYPDALIGAGTVINAEQCEKAIACGAKFIVSPGLSPAVAAVCKAKNVPYLPGVVTPTEVIQAIDLGLTTLKFFPASNFGGLKTIKAICAAFPQIKFMPTGGVNEENVLEFLAYDKIIACGGSWMMKGTPAEIEAKTKSAVALVGGNK
jgi:2-dehydro-3-deoxyphosphogluconate aldolase/(4S)-4-hydroxy-2-oxoglutarate aldolase